MKEFILGLMPGSILIYRYSSRFFSWTTFSLLVIEILPYLLIVLLDSYRLDLVFFGFLYLYSIYEYGYLINDKNATNEKKGATIRGYIDKFNFKFFNFGRIVALIFVLVYLINGDVNISIGLILILLLLPIFYFHNTLSNNSYRVLTFLLLNKLKILGRLLILSPAAYIYLLATVPHIITKLIHYLDSKKLISIEKNEFNYISLFIYLSYMVTLAIADYRMGIVAIPYFINHNKALFISWVKKI